MAGASKSNELGFDTGLIQPLGHTMRIRPSIARFSGHLRKLPAICRPLRFEVFGTNFRLPVEAAD